MFFCKKAKVNIAVKKWMLSWASCNLTYIWQKETGPRKWYKSRSKKMKMHIYSKASPSGEGWKYNGSHIIWSQNITYPEVFDPPPSGAPIDWCIIRRSICRVWIWLFCFYSPEICILFATYGVSPSKIYKKLHHLYGIIAVVHRRLTVFIKYQTQEIKYLNNWVSSESVG